MDTSVEVLTLDVDFEDYPNWVGDNESLLLSQTIISAEKMVNDNLDYITILKLNVKNDISIAQVVCGLQRKDLVESMEKVLNKCVVSEEYELAQRVKNLQDNIDEHNL